MKVGNLIRHKSCGSVALVVVVEQLPCPPHCDKRAWDNHLRAENRLMYVRWTDDNELDEYSALDWHQFEVISESR